MPSEKPLHYLTIDEASKLIQKRALSPLELTKAVLDRITAVDGRLKSYLNFMPDRAITEAGEAEGEIQKGNYKGPLHGIPLAVKDQLDLKGAPALIRGQSAKSPRDAAAVERLRRAGAVILGKLTMSSLPGDIPAPRNPWDTSRITGGSSTGPGAAVAAGLCLGALGEDTAGSIRNPASLCSLVGFKATYGLVSRRGLAPLSWSLDHCGPMTWTVEDNAHMLQAIAGFDAEDPTSVEGPIPNYTAALKTDAKGLKIGVPRDYIDACRVRTDSEVLTLVDKAIEQLKSLGARVEDVNIPALALATFTDAMIYYNEQFSAVRRNLKEIIKNGAPATRARMYVGLLTSAGDYIQAQRLRSRLRRECEDVFARVDVLALPCQMKPAPTFDESGPLDTLWKHLESEYQAPFNLVGLPALSLPCGFSHNLPVALQLVGKPFDEATVLGAAYAYQEQMKWYEKRPPM
ncbi:MAG TPA: amidase [Candidatus Binatia bacterium]|jgi:aspartyl-tRNA(Asn)/glutamyl-tRNA(Gln) amidotransferase subunit A